jgi:hypothetical protein
MLLEISTYLFFTVKTRRRGCQGTTTILVQIYRLKGREGATEGMKPQVILEGFYLMLKFMT